MARSSRIPELLAAVVLVATGAAAQEDKWKDSLDELLKKDVFFSRIAWTEHAGSAPLRIFVQKPALETPGYEQRTAESIGPWVRGLEEQFAARYAVPLGLTRRADRATSAVFVLLSEGDFHNYLNVSGRLSGNRSASYDPRLGLVVTFGDSFGARGPAHEKRWLLLREHTLFLMDAYRASDAARSPAFWFREGLSDYLAFHTEKEPACLSQPTVSREHLSLLAKAARSPATGVDVVHTLEELFAVRDGRSVVETAQARASAAGRNAPTPQEAYSAFLSEACLWNHFLQNGVERKYAPLHLRFLAHDLQGKGDLAHFREAFAGTELTLLEQEFQTWLTGETQRVLGERVDYGPLWKGLRPRAPGKGAPAGKTPTAGAASGAGIGLEPLDAEGWLALAVTRAARGDVASALELLRGLLTRSEPNEKGGLEADQRARVTREVERLEGWVTLRDAWLVSQVGKRIKLEVPGDEKRERFLTTLERIDAGELVLARNKAKLERLPVVAIAPEVLVSQMDAATTAEGSVPVRAWGLLLAGDARWDRSLGTDAKAEALRGDASSYAVLLREGLVADALDRLDVLAAGGGPVDAKQAQSAVDALTGLKESSADRRVAARKAALAGLATRAFEILYDSGPTKAELACKSEQLGDGRLRLIYEFEAPGEADDFVNLPQYLDAWRAQMPAVSERQLAVEEGELRLQGASCLRHVLTFEAPVSVRYESYYKEGNEQDSNTTVFTGLCADDEGSHDGATDWGHLFVIDRRKGRNDVAEMSSEIAFYLGRVYSHEVRRDPDGKLRALVDGAVVNEAEPGSRKGGFVFLFVHTNRTVGIQRLVIEGKPDAASLKARWIAARLRELGLGD